MTNIVKETMKHHSQQMSIQINAAALGLEKLWCIRSTGEIIGPFWGKRTSKNNKGRNAFGNLYDSEAKAKKARKYIKLVNKFLRWLP